MTIARTAPPHTFAPLVHLDDLAPYSPPLHHGTVNRRIFPADLGAGVEVIHGTLAPGGSADLHAHPQEWQMIFLLEGTGLLVLGDGEGEAVGPGAVVRLRPGTPHRFSVTGDSPAKVIVLYSPPLGPDSFLRLGDDDGA